MDALFRAMAALLLISLLALSPQEATFAQQQASTTHAPAMVFNPVGCQIGEVFTDMQAWWTNTSAVRDRGHLHIGVCFPYGKTLTGKVTFRVRTILYENPGSLVRDAIYIVGSNLSNGCGGNGAFACVPLATPRTLATCFGGTKSPDGSACTWWDTLVVDTSLYPSDGWQEFRFKGYIREPGGEEMIVSNGLHVYLSNGKGVRSSIDNPHSLVARGWYTNAGYTNASLSNPPLGPVSGIWSPSVRLDQGSGGKPVTGHLASVDPDFHHDNPGIIVHSGGGPYRGTLRVDTTKLDNGWHVLFLRTDALQLGSGSISSGALAITFEVQN